RKCLGAPDEKLRMAAARALARLTPRDSLRPLVGLLGAKSLDVRIEAGRLLRSLTGQTLGYAAYDPPEARARSRAAWQAWVRAHGRSARLFPAGVGLRHGRLLLCLFAPYKVGETDLSGRVLFAPPGSRTVCGCAGLADGRRVFADWDANALVELDAKGKVVWQAPAPGRPNSLECLDNGHLL